MQINFNSYRKRSNELTLFTVFHLFCTCCPLLCTSFFLTRLHFFFLFLSVFFLFHRMSEKKKRKRGLLSKCIESGDPFNNLHGIRQVTTFYSYCTSAMNSHSPFTDVIYVCWNIITDIYRKIGKFTHPTVLYAHLQTNRESSSDKTKKNVTNKYRKCIMCVIFLCQRCLIHL